MTSCSGCGDCCDPVAYVVSPQQLRAIFPAQLRSLDDETRANIEWARAHFTPIDRAEGLRRSPELKQGYTIGVASDGTAIAAITYFYECDAFDTDTRTCTAYRARPPMCSQYPWYGDRPDPTRALPARCSFNADVGRPVAVEITR